MISLLRRLHVIALLLLSMGVWLGWQDLPARIPAHFNAAGVADRWVATSFFVWCMPALIAIAMSVVLYAVEQAAARTPSMLNLGLNGAERLRSLSREQQAIVGKTARVVFIISALDVTIIMGLVTYAIHATALGNPQSARFVLAAGIPLLAITLGLAVMKLLATLKRESENAAQRVRM